MAAFFVIMLNICIIYHFCKGFGKAKKLIFITL